MNIRKRKKQVVSHLFMTMLGRHLEAWLNTPDAAEQKMLDDGHKSRCHTFIVDPADYRTRREVMEALLEPDVEDCKVEYVVQKVNGGEVVATFDTREDALALVLKHARQKKAKLQVMDSSTGELVLFAEEEVA